jgi:dimethylglycine catabolism A
MLRAFLADPDWAIKAKEGREKEIQRCRYCNLCLMHKRGEPALCVYAKE